MFYCICRWHHRVAVDITTPFRYQFFYEVALFGANPVPSLGAVGVVVVVVVICEEDCSLAGWTVSDESGRPEIVVELAVSVGC